MVVFLFPSTPPKLSTTRLRERSLHMHCYRLHLRVLTYHAVNRQFYSPLSTSVEPNSPPQSRFNYGGGGGNRTLVLPVIRFVSTNCNIFIPQGYPHCQEVFLYSIKQTLQLLEQNIMQSKETP